MSELPTPLSSANLDGEQFRAALLRKLPFKGEVVLCDGRDLIHLETESPFGAEPAQLAQKGLPRCAAI